MMHHKEGKTYIFVRPYFMADYVLSALEDNPEYVICHHRRKKGIISKIARLMLYHFPSLESVDFLLHRVFTDEYISQIRNVQKTDKVILWAVENEKDIMILSNLLAADKVTSFLWDPMRQVIHDSESQASRYPASMKNAGITVCSFDRKDADKYGFKYVGQVYHKTNIEIKDFGEEDGVFFVGADKGRAKSLAALASYFQENGINYDFRILKDKHSRIENYPILEKSVIFSPIDYPETLKLINKARCLLDILQPGQSGVTIRSMEALFYGKKLITDNQDIKDEDFYHPDRVYILGDDSRNGRDLKEFILSPMPTLPDSKTRASHEIETWIKQL